MSPVARQRIIGLGLLLLLMAILVPWALYVPDDLRPQLDAAQPKAPEILWQPIEPAVDDAVQVQLLQQIEEQRAALLSDEFRESNRLQAYALELGHYASQKEAAHQLEALHDAGYRAFIRTHDQQTVLYAGPEIEQARLETVAEQLAADARFAFPLANRVNYQP